MIKVGTVFQLEVANIEKETYRCKVMDSGEDKLFIDYPANEKTNRTEIFPIGTTFHVHFHQDSVVYSFVSKLISKQKIKDIPALVLSFDKTKLRRIQRRNFLRVETMLDISVRTSATSFATVTADLSGGGAAIVLQNEHQVTEGELLDMMLVLPINDTTEYIPVTGKALRIYVREEIRILSIEFVDIIPKHQQLIVRYCYLRQLAKR
ncbi:flagellar brake protein [Gracilibacillus alcaliphilus]|uniref:flagellar brake protein n=1 Tax=Gracilibacillus alcaliphilus TaxID=1401441 RepID=UPI00195E6E44|nr:PilZ domain-containing protein [Gracilibacillus alcaliphilus]MBM7675169.1 c-di-GMP-binding flagellar brake protein YcgR [Gracilibacillus alcaliphilus]